MGQSMSEEKLSPEQEAELKKFSLACSKVLFTEGGVVDKVVQTLQGGDIPTTLANMAYDITKMIDEKAGGVLDEELIVPAAADVLGQIAEAAQVAKIPVKGREIAMATRIMLERYMTEQGEDPQQVKGMFDNVNHDEIGNSIDRNQGA